MTKYAILLTHAFFLALILASSHALLKWITTQSHESYFQLLWAQWPLILLAIGLYGFVFFYYILVLRSSPVSTLYPVYTGLSVLMVLLAGRFLFQEVVTPYQVAGAGFILLGIVLMGRA